MGGGGGEGNTALGRQIAALHYSTTKWNCAHSFHRPKVTLIIFCLANAFTETLEEEEQLAQKKALGLLLSKLPGWHLSSIPH